jgi:cellulose synthase/poly-beta-1,6-N-acetylglucosamine synthase-like glycosyltransferase
VFFQIQFYAAIALTFLYAYFFVLYLKHWNALPFYKNTFQNAQNTEGVYRPHIFISILIPVRDEQETILQCLNSILAGSYPKHLFEIIVIDDHSTDNTAQLVRSLNLSNIHIIELKEHVQIIKNQPFKKKAIELAIGKAQGELIVTTDGDCIVPTDWLKYIASFYETEGKRFIAAPVCFYEENSFFEKFQSLDYIGMMGITGAGVQGRFTHICNGANLAYEKKLFYEVGGFRDIDHVASGDDVLLMQKVAKLYPEALGFLKNPEVTVLTRAKPTIKDFVYQRLRWASKSSSYTEFYTIFQLTCVFLFCLNVLINICLSIFYDIQFGYILIFQLGMKYFMDYLFLNTMTRFFNRQDLMRVFVKAQIFHVLYIVGVGFLSNIKKTYVWKGRETK